MNVPSQMFFNDINHGYRAAIVKKSYLWLLAFFYYEKVRRTMRTAIASYLLNLFFTLCGFIPVVYLVQTSQKNWSFSRRKKDFNDYCCPIFQVVRTKELTNPAASKIKLFMTSSRLIREAVKYSHKEPHFR